MRVQYSAVFTMLDSQMDIRLNLWVSYLGIVYDMTTAPFIDKTKRDSYKATLMSFYN